MMALFYKSFIESLFSFCIVAWFGNLTLTNRNRLNSLVKVAGKVIGVSQIQPIDIYYRQVLNKAHFKKYKSSLCYPLGIVFGCRVEEKKRFKVFFVCLFVSVAVGLINFS